VALVAGCAVFLWLRLGPDEPGPLQAGGAMPPIVVDTEVPAAKELEGEGNAMVKSERSDR
jgi:hypothetical protein